MTHARTKVRSTVKQDRDVLRMMLAQGLKPVAVDSVIGMIAAPGDEG
jgi:hypothetical protein